MRSTTLGKRSKGVKLLLSSCHPMQSLGTSISGSQKVLQPSSNPPATAHLFMYSSSVTNSAGESRVGNGSDFGISLALTPRSSFSSCVPLGKFCCSVAHLCPTLQPQGLQHARLLRPSLSLGFCSNSCPLNQ